MKIEVEPVKSINIARELEKTGEFKSLNSSCQSPFALKNGKFQFSPKELRRLKAFLNALKGKRAGWDFRQQLEQSDSRRAYRCRVQQFSPRGELQAQI